MHFPLHNVAYNGYLATRAYPSLPEPPEPFRVTGDGAVIETLVKAILHSLSDRIRQKLQITIRTSNIQKVHGIFSWILRYPVRS